MSLTPPSEMKGIERIGAFLAGIGILALLVSFLSASSVRPWLNIALAGLFFVSAAMLGNKNRKRYQILIITLVAAGLASLVFLSLKLNLQGWPLFFAVFGVTSVGAVLYYIGAFGQGPAGIKNNGIFHSSASRQGGVLSWMLAITFTGFYAILYWYPDHLFGLVAAADPLYNALTGGSSFYIDDQGAGHVSNQWFVYGLIYTVAVVVMGFRYILKYRHNRYQILRTLSVMFFQLVIAFSLPTILETLNAQQKADFVPVIEEYQPIYKDYESSKNTFFAYQDSLNRVKSNGEDETYWQTQVDAALIPYEANRATAQQYNDTLMKYKPSVASHYFSYFWPLDYDIIQPGMIKYYTGEEPFDGVHVPYGDSSGLSTQAGFGGFGWTVLIIALIMSTIGVVVLTYFFGKRWYCSWVCGCGGLAETAGDPFRQQSDKSLKAWKIERYSIHSVLVLITAVTALLLLDWQFHFLGNGLKNGLKSGYGFAIASIFAGVVGTGFYPILGSRVWCRFGCPQAAVLGIIQKYFSRFRITTNGGQCISCGNCSTYCEMGIDVKSYAQRGQNIVRASCVGCGVCSAVCPRGVLNLENGPTKDRINDLNPLAISSDEVKVNL